MTTYLFKTEQFLPRPIEEVFAFFADAMNLETLTPDWLRFTVLTPAPIVMQTGTLIDYQLRIRGLPIQWQSEIAVWEPPRRFVDVQRRGPYRLWNHEHAFDPRGDGTWVRDRVEYAVPGGAIVRRLFVAPDLERIFQFRRERLAELFGRPAQPETVK